MVQQCTITQTCPECGQVNKFPAYLSDVVCTKCRYIFYNPDAMVIRDQVLKSVRKELERDPDFYENWARNRHAWMIELMKVVGEAAWAMSNESEGDYQESLLRIAATAIAMFIRLTKGVGK